MPKTSTQARSRIPKKPAIREDRDRWLEKYVDAKVRPYMRHLLDAAQRKLTRHKLHYTSGMGTDFFVIDDKIHHDLTEAISGVSISRPRNRWERAAVRHFPELVEFYRLTIELDDWLHYDIGDMSSSKGTHDN